MSVLEQWSLVTVEDCCEILDNKRIPVNEQDRDRRIGEVPYYGANGLQGYIDDFIFDEPLILIAEDGGRFDEFARRPIAYRITGKSWVNNHAHVLRAKEAFCQDAVFYSLEHKDIQSAIVGGTRSKLNQGALREISLFLPNAKPEQTKIAEVLSTVDRVIEQTEALIAKQHHIKTGLMQNLLTRGIDKYGNLRTEQTHLFKDSPLGRIPVEWDVRPCGALCRQIVVGIVVRPAQYYKPDGVPVLRSANVKENSVDPSNLVFMSERDNETLSKSKLYTGDLVTVRTGYPGTTAVVPPEFHGSNCIDLVVSRAHTDRIRPEFLSIWINSDHGKRQVLEGQGGLAQQHFNVGEMKALLVKVPCLKEQQRIEELLILQNSTDRELMKNLAKLRSLKTGLMQDLLTGKRRVTSLLQSERRRAKVYAER